ncbi:hypothetical protein ACEPAF_9089 [Sanghuangporus sanghuang]
MSELDSQLAAKLKEEGNKFFVGKQYSQAHDKYSKALKVGGDNAIIYANRAACCMSLGRYLDACSDARKATVLDPEYAKGWGRLATAEQELGSWDKAIEAYKTALSKLQTKELTAAEKKQKEQYEAGLAISEKKANPEPPKVHRLRAPLASDRPYGRATAMLNQRPHECRNSSVNTINMAGNDFEGARAGMRQLKKVRLANGQIGLAGRLDVSWTLIIFTLVADSTLEVLANLTNAVLSDRRSFYIDDPNWTTKYNEQIMLEIQNSQAWTEDGPEVVLKEAQQRVRERGWDAARPALAVTVRGWIMRAFLSAGMKKDYMDAEQFYRNAIDVLERGREIWSDVEKDERGSIFEHTFVFGVRAIHLEAFMQAHASTEGTDPRFSAEVLDKLASDLLHDVDQIRFSIGPFLRTFHGEAFFLAYFIYPAAEACAIKAYSLKHMAKGTSGERHKQLLEESAEYYAQAAHRFPEDDEYHCQYLMNSLGSWWLLKTAPLKKTLPLLEDLKKTYPKMQRIWEYSALGLEGRDAMIEKCLNYYDDVRRKIAEGELTEDDSHIPPFQI